MEDIFDLDNSSFAPSSVPTYGGSNSTPSTDNLGAYRCLPRDEMNFEWTAFLPPIVFALQLTWIVYLLRSHNKNNGDVEEHLPASRTTTRHINRTLIISYLLTLLHVSITLFEVAVNQSRHTLHAIWAIPFSWFCIALSIAIFVKLFWVDRHFFIGLFTSYIPVSAGSIMLGWGIECNEAEVHEDNCYVLYNDEVIWVTALGVTLVSLLTLGVWTLAAAILCKWFCGYRTVYETPWVRYIERVDIGWKGYIKLFYLMLVWVLMGVFLGTLSFTADDGPEGNRPCLSPYGLSAIVVAGVSGFLSVIVSMYATRAKFVRSRIDDDQETPTSVGPEE